MSKKNSHGSRKHSGDAKRIKDTHEAARGKRGKISGTQGSASGDFVGPGLSILARQDFSAFDFPCYPLEVVDFQGHYFLPIEAFTCRS